MSDTTFLISGGFFDAVDSDRLYSADQMNHPYKKLIHDGINREADGTTPGFAVTAGGGMNVLVATGNAMIGGKWAENKAVQTIAVAGNTSGSARIDSIILQCDKSRAVRAVQIVYRQGTTAAPDLVSDDDITELRLANIRVPSAVSSIASENITDTRGGAECPWVRSVFDAPDARYIVEEYTGSELAGAYQTVKSAVDSIRYAAQSGQPTVALQASDMIDSNLVYLYQGSETGYSTGYLYYYSDAAGAWIRGAQYGASVVDTALDEDSENPVQNKAIAVAIKTVRSFVVEVPGSAAAFSGSIAAGDFAKALATYTAGSGVYAVKDGEVYQLSAASSSTMTFTQMYHGTMNFIKQIQITSADTFTVTNTALSSSAADTSYNNTTSGLTATDVQAAIDENAAAVTNVNGRLREQTNEVDRAEMNDVESLIYKGLTVTKCTVANGTIANPNNTNAVNTSNYIPCAAWDTVTIYPVRALPEGHTYKYAYATYDENKQIVNNISTVSVSNKTVTVKNEAVKFIRFAIFEYDESDDTVATLRADMYYNTPIAIVRNGNVIEDLACLSFIHDESTIDFIAGNMNSDGDPLKITKSDKYVSITFPCQTDRTYTITRKYGNRFKIVCTSVEPAFNIPCEKVVNDKTLDSYTFIPPVGAKYVIVTLQNDNVDTEHTHEEVIESCNVYALSAVDYDARAELSKALMNYSQLIVDANNSDYWAIMGIGFYGENYPKRNWNISSDYLSNIISVTTDDGYATRYVLYNSDKSLIYRSDFYREEINISSLMEEYGATYVRFEVQALDESGAEIKTPIDDVSRYTHVHLYVLRDSGIKGDETSKKWYEDSLVQSTYLDRIKQAKYVYANTDSGETPHPVLTLLHFSDVHGNMNAMRYALDINEMFEGDIDDMLHTGDVVTANFSDGIGNWVSSGCANKVLNVIGNHDTEENLVLQAAGKDNVYNTIFAPYIAQWGVTQPTGVDTSGSDNYHALYYYKDYSAAEVRLIVLDTNFWDTAQKSWLTSVLTDAKTNGLCVVIACHDVKLLTEMTDSNFSSYNGTGITETGNSYANQPADWLDPVNDFINDGGNFACILAGHNHDGHMGTMTNYPNIFVYVSDKASVARVSGAARITGEMNANAVSIVVINPVEKLFKIVKIGAQIDGKMRPQNVFCYDYANKQIVAQW